MLSVEEIERIKDRIVKFLSPKKIILFGSYATGTATEDSDLDLVIIADISSDPRSRNMMVRRLFPGRNFAFDVFVFTPEEESFKDIKGTILYSALQRGKVIYEHK